MRSQIQLKVLTEKTIAAERRVEDPKATDSPTVDFIESMKNRLGNIEKEERSIEEDFDDLCSAISSPDILKVDD